MPSKTPQQARLMAASAHNPKFAKKVGVPVKVAKEFNRADMAASRGGITAGRRSGMMPPREDRQGTGILKGKRK